MSAVTRAELEALVKRQQKSLDRAEAKIAALQKSGKRATTKNKVISGSLKEALERQTATAEILKVISSSPTDTQPVFEAIVKNGAQLLHSKIVSLRLVVGAVAELAASTVPAPLDPIPLTDDRSLTARSILRREVTHVPDVFAEEWVGEATRRRAEHVGYRSAISAPMLKEGVAIGAINVMREAPRPFTENEIKLLETFADQAVIAIENVRLFNETKEALEQQTATADILKVISRSPTDLQPVFDAILDKVIRLCDAHLGHLGLCDGEKYQYVALRGANVEFAKFASERGPFRPSPGGAVERMIAERQTIQDADLAASSRYRERSDPFAVALVELGDARTFMLVPMLKEGRVVGGISIYRPEVRPFSRKQIDLVSTFANQAVIAIENVRLFKELQARNAEVTEALEQQTATAEILKVIASSPSDVQPVFDAIVETAKRLLGGFSATVTPIVDGMVHLAAYTRIGESGERALKSLFPAPLSQRYHFARAVETRAPYCIGDAETNTDVTAEWREMARQRGFRSVLFVPMLREGVSIGTINVTRREPGAFSDHQINLLKTFADQAVIAIENVRLFNETREALERQTVISEILRAMSGSPTDTQPVFDAIVNSGVHLFGGMNMSLRLIKGDHTETVASTVHDASSAFVAPLGDGRTASSRALLHREVVQIPDIQAAEEWVGDGLKQRAAQRGWRAIVTAPLLREDNAIGTIVVTRATPGLLADKQVALLKTFADQAVIAIENVRLFHEIQDKSAQLEVASRHKSEFLASMSHELRTPLNAILGFNEMIIHGLYGEVPSDMKVPLDDIQSSGKHLLRLINNVLDLAKIEAGRMDLVLADYSIYDTAESVRSALRPLAAEKKIEFIISVPEDIPLVHGDSGRIMQCLINLAGNSLKFTKAGKVEISVSHHDGLLTCCVSDTGVGIPPDKIGGLFTEFKQTDATIASEYGGTGLGLSITKKFIEMHGGRIWVESEVGQGSRFSFEIPLRAAAKATEEAHA